MSSEVRVVLSVPDTICGDNNCGLEVRPSPMKLQPMTGLCSQDDDISQTRAGTVRERFDRTQLNELKCRRVL